MGIVQSWPVDSRFCCSCSHPLRGSRRGCSVANVAPGSAKKHYGGREPIASANPTARRNPSLTTMIAETNPTPPDNRRSVRARHDSTPHIITLVRVRCLSPVDVRLRNHFRDASRPVTPVCRGGESSVAPASRTLDTPFCIDHQGESLRTGGRGRNANRFALDGRLRRARIV